MYWWMLPRQLATISSAAMRFHSMSQSGFDAVSETDVVLERSHSSNPISICNSRALRAALRSLGWRSLLTLLSGLVYGRRANGRTSPLSQVAVDLPSTASRSAKCHTISEQYAAVASPRQQNNPSSSQNRLKSSQHSSTRYMVFTTRLLVLSSPISR